jgi:hypothetical protein
MKEEGGIAWIIFPNVSREGMAYGENLWNAKKRSKDLWRKNKGWK